MAVKIGLLTLSGFYMLFVVPDGLNIIKVEFSLPFFRVGVWPVRRRISFSLFTSVSCFVRASAICILLGKEKKKEKKKGIRLTSKLKF